MALQCSTVFVALADPDGKTLVRFYRQLFGQEPIRDVPEYAEFQLPGLRLGIFKPSTVHRSEFEGQAGSISLCIEVDQLEKAIASVEQAFIETRLTGSHLFPSDIITSSHGREVYAYDPAGNRMILHEGKLPKRPQTDLPIIEMPKAEVSRAEVSKAEVSKAEMHEAETYKTEMHEAELQEIQIETPIYQAPSDPQKRKNSSRVKKPG